MLFIITLIFVLMPLTSTFAMDSATMNTNVTTSEAICDKRTISNCMSIVKPSIDLKHSSLNSSINQDIYDRILSALVEVNNKVDIPISASINSDLVFSIWSEVLQDHPELFYAYNFSYSYYGYTVGYYYPKKQIQEMQAIFEQKVNGIVQKVIKTDSTPWENELRIHDYIVNNTKYNIDGLNNDSLTNIDFSAYGILVNGTGVCEGYSKAMQLLLQKAGIECKRISGLTTMGPHDWNLVKIEDQWFHVDVTWDDPVPDKGYHRYHYYNQCESVMKKDHTYWDTSLYPEAATSDRFASLADSNKWAISDNSYIYYSKSSDGYLHRMKFDGSGDQILGDCPTYANYLTLDGEWLYFSNEYGGLYKIKCDGTCLTKLDSVNCGYVYLLDRTLYYTDLRTQEQLSLDLGALPETWTNYATSKQKSSKDNWTITFNKAVDSTTVNVSNIFVATDSEGTNKVSDISVEQVEDNLCQVKVNPPGTGWQTGGTYYLFISTKVKSSSGGSTLKNGIRMEFTIP